MTTSLENFCIPHVDGCDAAIESADMPTMDRLEREARRLALARAVQGGKSLAETAEEFGVSVPTVRNACNEHGVSPPKPKVKRPRPPAEKTIEIIADLLAGGQSYEAIAEKHGLTKQRIGLIKKQAEEAGIFEAAKVSLEKMRERERDIRRLERENESLKAVQPPRTPTEIEQRNAAMVADVKAGMTASDAAKKYGVSRILVYQVLRVAGVDPPETTALHTKRLRRYLNVLADLIGGMGVTQIKEKRKLSGTGPIYRVWREAYKAGVSGLPKPPAGGEK